MALKKILSFFFFVVWGIGCCSLSVASEESVTLPDGYAGIEDHLPDDMAELLPEGLFSQTPEEALAAAETLTRPEYLLRVILELVGLRMNEVLSLFCTLLGILCLSAILHRLREILSGGGEGVTFCMRLCLYALMVTQAAGMVSWLKTYFSNLCALLTGLIPVMGTLYALGGNVTEAAANGGILTIFLNFCEYVTAYVTPAVCGVSLALALLDAFGSQQVRFAPLGGLIKRWYITILGFVTFLLGVALSTQTILASRTDTLSMKGIKYAVGQMIPVVGGAVSGTLGTVAAGVELLRGVSGVCGLILLGLLLLPTLIQLLLFRACYQTAATVAAMIGCDGEARLLGEVESLYGYMIAATGISSVLCVLALSLFAHGATALGG